MGLRNRHCGRRWDRTDDSRPTGAVAVARGRGQPPGSPHRACAVARGVHHRGPGCRSLSLGLTLDLSRAAIADRRDRRGSSGPDLRRRSPVATDAAVSRVLQLAAHGRRRRPCLLAIPARRAGVAGPGRARWRDMAGRPALRGSLGARLRSHGPGRRAERINRGGGGRAVRGRAIHRVHVGVLHEPRHGADLHPGRRGSARAGNGEARRGGGPARTRVRERIGIRRGRDHPPGSMRSHSPLRPPCGTRGVRCTRRGAGSMRSRRLSVWRSR